jgi:tRNA (cmo5U34)-methyltransferase
MGDLRDDGLLTVLFVPIQYRLRILKDAHRALRPGGSLLLVEKVLGGSADIDDRLVDLYYALKAENGYTAEQIEAKKHSLEGTQVPITAAWNEDNIRRAGFSEFDCVWRWGNFAAWWAVK